MASIEGWKSYLKGDPTPANGLIKADNPKMSDEQIAFGIKRLNEGRTERGIPILSKLPYINRLFRNTAIGRETTSLMMMVTPRIIIQEEEEENLLGGPPQP